MIKTLLKKMILGLFDIDTENKFKRYMTNKILNKYNKNHKLKFKKDFLRMKEF